MSNKFDEIYNVSELTDLIKNAKPSEGLGKEVPFGKYECTINKLELKESKTGKPMVSAWFKIINGEFKNQIIFMNQLVDWDKKNDPEAKAFMAKYSSVYQCFKEFGVIPAKYSGYTQLESQLQKIADDPSEFLLEYGQNAKKFNTFKIIEIYE